MLFTFFNTIVYYVAVLVDNLTCGDTVHGSTVGLLDLFDSDHNGRVVSCARVPCQAMNFQPAFKANSKAIPLFSNLFAD